MERSMGKQNIKRNNFLECILDNLRNLKQNKIKIKLYILLFIVSILFLVALFGEYIVPNDPYAQDLSNALSPPSKEFIFGTDRYGRCLFSRIVVGAKTTMFSSLGLVVIISTFGTIVGAICGYMGGKVDEVVMRISDIFLAFPGMVFAIAVSGVLGGGIVNAVISLALISWPKFSRLARGHVLTIKNSAYIQAAKLSGCSHMKIIFKHIFPNILGPIIVTATLDIGVMMMELAGLSFLGLGAMPPTAEWGSMMSNGRSMIQSSPWVIFAPGLAIFITVIIFNLLGDTVRDYLDVSNND
ncbi:MAG: ABC transporter permease [Turicibacter sp.]|nr:ABC transporter permease [Turicibacter sp.]